MPVQQLPAPCWSLWPVKLYLPMMPPLGESDVHPNTPPRCSRLRYRSPWPALRGREKILTPLYAQRSSSQPSLNRSCTPHFFRSSDRAQLLPLGFTSNLGSSSQNTGQAGALNKQAVNKGTITKVKLNMHLRQ